MPTNPWLMLAILFLARTAMGYSFQSIGSSGPAIAAALAIDFALIGTLIGLFKLPGVILSIPSGMLARRASDRTLIGGGLAALGIGCAITAVASDFSVAALGRLLTGIGATVANLYFTKATLDWFAGTKGLPLAMALLVNSWPVGIAIGLMTQGPMTVAWGWTIAMLVSSAAGLLAALLIFAVYKDAPGRTVPPAAGFASLRALSKQEWIDISLIGIVWSFLNVGLALVVGFSPALLASLGHDLASAGRLVSLGTWIGILAIPVGGAIAVRTGYTRGIVALCTAASAAAFLALAHLPEHPALYAFFGVAAFAGAGPVMSQPSGLLAETNRAAGMGVFYTVYYLAMGLLPALAGLIQSHYGPRAPLVLAAGLMILSMGCQIALARRA